MPKGKIDKVKLNQMLRVGKTQRECAKAFGVTEGAISQVKKELNVTVIKSVALENAHRIVGKNLDAIERTRSAIENFMSEVKITETGKAVSVR